jgi:hypothetical protein
VHGGYLNVILMSQILPELYLKGASSYLKLFERKKQILSLHEAEI